MISRRERIPVRRKRGDAVFVSSSLRVSAPRVENPAPAILLCMLSQKLREHGVVGAGGAGFPTYVKAQSQVEFLIANGAECEPLIHKDAELMKHFPAGILAGMTSMMDATGARSGKFGIKTKNAES